MRRVVAALVLAGVTGVAAGGCSGSAGPGPGHARPPVSYYLALGDSLALGAQPNASGTSVPSSQGYADQLYAILRRTRPGLRLVKLGCIGETTATMIHGGVCRYPGGSQLAAATSFLRAHRAQVSLVTLDIGANDPETCLTTPTPTGLVTCATKTIPQAVANLGTILARLRQADAGAHIVAMNYYLPALAQWRHGFTGEMVARLVELGASEYNALLDREYRKYGVRVADVFSAFSTSDFGGKVDMRGFGSLPGNVAAICRWTWECAGPPRGPNQHPNQAGYQVITHAFLAAGANQPTPRR
jgi:lysophospholipase L1-like esterase